MLKKSFKHNLGFFKSIYRHTALTELLNFLRMKKDIKKVKIKLDQRCQSRDSSVGRALDWRSKGPRFDPGSRHSFNDFLLWKATNVCTVISQLDGIHQFFNLFTHFLQICILLVSKNTHWPPKFVYCFCIRVSKMRRILRRGNNWKKCTQKKLFAKRLV